MNVKIIDILESVKDGYRVILEVGNERFFAEWDGKKPEKSIKYDVEVDIDDEFIWNTNIVLSVENVSSISQDEKHINVVAKLDYNHEANLASLNVGGSIVLIDLEGVDKNISNQWVKIQCSSIKVCNTNL